MSNETNTSTELVLAPKSQLVATTPWDRITDVMDFIDRMGAWLMNTRNGLGQPGEGRIIASYCYFEKITPFDFFRTFDIIEGKPVMKTIAMLSKFIQRGGKYKILRRDAEVASLEMEYSSHRLIFTTSWDEMQNEPFVFRQDGKTLKPAWSTPRGRRIQLFKRAISEAIDVICPEIKAGIPSESVAEDYLPDNGNLQLEQPSQVVPTTPDKPKAPIIPIGTVEKASTPPPEKPKEKKQKVIEQPQPELPIGKTAEAAGCSAEPAKQAETPVAATSTKADASLNDRFMAIICPDSFNPNFDVLNDPGMADILKGVINVAGEKAQEIPDRAMRYFLSRKGWLEPNQTPDKLSDVNKKAICANPKGFLNAILGEKFDVPKA
jgi:hypothetical protein